MEIAIQELSEQNRHDLNRCDGAFTVTSKLLLHVENGIPTYTILNVPPYRKSYLPTEVDFDSYQTQRDQGVFFAYGDGDLAGQIFLHKHWNQLAYIEDIAVDALFRRRGIGRSLIQHAIAWAKARELPGIMLETQDTNVGACLFYQQSGFRLGGFDRYLYRAIPEADREIALYWYLFFE